MRTITITFRLFWRGFNVPQRPYYIHQIGVYAFGIGPLGCMFWPPVYDP